MNGLKVITVSLDMVKTKVIGARAFVGTDGDKVFKIATDWIESKIGSWFPSELENGTFRIWTSAEKAAGYMTIANDSEGV